jgi:hypothetical protein
MFHLNWTAEAKSNYDAIKAKAQSAQTNRQKTGGEKAAKSTRDEGLYKQVRKAIELLSANPRHVGLHTHEYHSFPHPWEHQAKVFEAYAQNQTPGAYRIFWCYGPDEKQITILAITRHP